MVICTLCSSNRAGWIGLQNADNDCGCAGASVAACLQCRSLWTWTDGVDVDATTYANWGSSHPAGSSEPCGLLLHDGSWIGRACSYSYTFICKKRGWWCAAVYKLHVLPYGRGVSTRRRFSLRTGASSVCFFSLDNLFKFVSLDRLHGLVSGFTASYK